MTLSTAAQMPGRWTAAQLGLAAALAFTVLIGASESGALVTSVRAVSACIGAGVIAFYILCVVRQHDRIDRLVLASLLLFLATCVLSSSPRLSFDAATTALAYAAAFYLARRAVMTPPGRDLAVLVLGLLGTTISVMLMVVWGPELVRWTGASGGAIPPLNLNLPALQYTPLRAGMVVALLMPATIGLARRPGIWPLGLVGTAASLMVILVSGSRSVWLGGIAALLVIVAIGHGRLLPSRRGRTGLALGAVALIVLMFPQLISRVATSSTVELRFAIWERALGAWTQAPITGHGPATFASAFIDTGFYNAYDAYIPYAHNAIVHTLFEMGALGIVGLGLLAWAVFSSSRKSFAIKLGPLAAVAFFVVASLTEDPSQYGYLVVPFVVWVSLLVPEPPPPREQPPPVAVIRGAVLALLCAVGAMAVMTLAASLAYDRARSAAEGGTVEDVVEQLGTAVALDPSFALYRRDLGVWQAAAGRYTDGTRELRRAASLNPNDQAAKRALALVELEGGNSAAMDVATAAFLSGQLQVENALVAGYVAGRAGDFDAEREYLTQAVRLAPWLLAAREWTDVFPDSSKAGLIKAALASWSDYPTTYRNLQARTWLAAMDARPIPSEAEPALAAAAAVIECHEDEARSWLQRLQGGKAFEAVALEARLLVDRAFEGKADASLETLIELRDPGLARRARGGVIGQSPVVEYTRDIQVYHRLPIPALFGPVLPTHASGLSAWLNDPVAAADVGAPGSGLAHCR